MARLGIDMDGVIVDFNAEWVRLHREEFGSDLEPEMVQTWDGLHTLAGFADMAAFWTWAEGGTDRPSIFRHMVPFPGAIETLRALAAEGHRLHIVTAKPPWAVPDTLRWLADHDLPLAAVHFEEEKHTVPCDIYLDDAPHVLDALAAHRLPNSLVCRMIRPWNRPIDGVADVTDWQGFHDAVTKWSSTRTAIDGPAA